MNYEIVIPNADGTLKRNAIPYVDHNGIIKPVAQVFQRPIEGGDVRCVWARERYLYLKTDYTTFLSNAYLTDDENAEVKLQVQAWVAFVIPQTQIFGGVTYKIRSLKFEGGPVDQHGVFVYFYGMDADGMVDTPASYFYNYSNRTNSEIYYCYNPEIPKYNNVKYSYIRTGYDDRGTAETYRFKCRFTYSPVF